LGGLLVFWKPPESGPEAEFEDSVSN